MTDNQRRLLAYFGHHKCASTWIHRILAEATRVMGLRHAYLHNPAQFGGDLAGYVARNRLDVISYVNADATQTSEVQIDKGFHVIRDPRDLLVSAYFSHLRSHPTEDWPELEPHRDRLQRAAKSDGLMLEFEFSSPVIDQIAGWDYEQPNVLELRQEDVTKAPYDHFLRIFDFLGLLDDADYTKGDRIRYDLRTAWNAIAARAPAVPTYPLRQLPGERLLGIVYEFRFAKISGGRKRGTEDEESHYRKGTPGDWRNHFDPPLLEAFQERYGDLVVDLGYETDRDWGATIQAS